MQRKYLIITILAVLGLMALWTVLSIARTGWLDISVPAHTPNNAPVSIQIIQNSTTKPTEMIMDPGQHKRIRLSPGTVRVDGSAGAIHSIDVVRIKGWFATTKLATPRGEQRAIHKLGSDAQYCPIKTSDGRVYSYNCTGEGVIYRHNKLDSNKLDSRTTLFGGAKFSALQPLGQGVIGLLQAEDNRDYNLFLRYINLQTETMDSLQVPKAVQDLLAREQPEITTSADGKTMRFALVFRQSNAVFSFNSPSDINPVKLDLPKNATLNDDFGITTAQIFGDRLVMYAGQTDTDDEAGSGSSKKTPSQENSIYEFDKTGKLALTILLPKEFIASDVNKVSSSVYTVEDNAGMDFYDYSHGSFQKIVRLSDAAHPLVVGGKVYTRAGGVLYKFEPRAQGLFSLESVFSSPGITVSELYGGPNGILFTGNAARFDPRPLDIYELLDTPQTIAPLEERMSLESLSSVITAYDYDDQTIIFSLLSTGADGADYNVLRGRMQALLDERDIDTGGRSVELFPLN